MTDRYAVFGNPVGHSLSPRIHALFAAQTGQDLRYEAILAPRDAFASAVAAFRAAGPDPARGANVTVPFKEEAFRLATRHTARAEAAGAVNTLCFRDDGTILGDNTDGAGLVRDIEHNLGVRLAGQRLLVLGAGGAARGAMLPLLLAGPERLVVANRTVDKAERLAAAFARLPGCALTTKPAAAGFDALGGEGFDVVINATSAGLEGAALPLPDSAFAGRALAYDMVYGRDTAFMAQARAAGCRVSDGLGMLVEQAGEAFFVWRGMRPDTAAVLAALATA